jgi:Pyruvate/2-oxoacid:ferredoxin oxidoreductase gamma subunit
MQENQMTKRKTNTVKQMAKINDFAIKIANANGTGSASANSMLTQVIFRMGIPVSGKNVFPSNIQYGSIKTATPLASKSLIYVSQ